MDFWQEIIKIDYFTIATLVTGNTSVEHTRLRVAGEFSLTEAMRAYSLATFSL
jgi:hypothetical protein